MTPYQIALLTLTVLAMSAGQILFKLAAQEITTGASWIQQILLNRFLIVAGVVYVSATAAWVALLRQIPLNIAYPMIALVYFVVPVLGHFFLQEPLRWQTFVGALVITLGIWISVGLE